MRVTTLPPAERTELQRRLLEPIGGDAAPNLFSSLVRHPALFEVWLPFCLRLLRCPEFPERQRELVILRVAWRSRAGYEWAHHARLSRRAGLSEADIRAVAEDLDDRWSSTELDLLRAVDELYETQTLCEETWDRLRGFLNAEQLITLPMLVGHYILLAGTLNSLEIPIDERVAEFAPTDQWLLEERKS